MMQTVWDVSEEEKKRRAMLGAPLEGTQYKQDASTPQNVQEAKNPNSLAKTAQGMVVGRGIGKAIDYAGKQAEKGFDYATEKAKDIWTNSQAPTTPDAQYVAQDMQEGYSSAPLSETAVTNPMDYTAAPASAPADSAAATLAENTPAGDVTSGMVSAPLAEGATNAVAEGATNAVAEGATNAVAEGATQAVAEGATQAVAEGATNAVAEGAASAAVEGAAGSLAGPLAGGIELAKTGDAGAAAGAALGTYAGAALGSMLGPAGTVVGGMVGSYLGKTLGGYLT